MDQDLQPRGCLTALLDLSFTEFVTSRLLRGLYIILLVLVAIGALAGIIGGLVAMFTRGFLAGLATVVGTAIGTLVAAILVRVWIELIMVLFRIAENTNELVRQGRRGDRFEGRQGDEP